MSTNSLATVGRQGRFTQQAAFLPARANPVSHMTLQAVMQILAALDQKIDSLSVWQPPAVPAKPVESRPVESKPAQPTTVPAKKVDRKGLLDFFD